MTTYGFPTARVGWWPRVVRDPVLPERLLAKLWRAKAGASLQTTDGQTVQVIYPGRPAPGHGPDFRDAILKLGSRTVKGPVELHRVPSDWKAHGHDADQAYDNVVLHVVASTSETQRDPSNQVKALTTVPASTAPAPAYAKLPTIVLSGDDGEPLTATSEGPLGMLASLENDALKDHLRDAGMRRFEEHVEAAQQTLEVRSADATLFARIADGLGYAENRSGFAELARRVPLTVLRAAGHSVEIEQRAGFIERLLLGGSGLSPRTNEWDAIVGTAPMGAIAWRTAGVRPANHPRRRLAALAQYVAASDPLGFVDWLKPAVAEGAGALIQRLTVAAEKGPAPRTPALVGEARAKEIAVNAALPVLAATGNTGARLTFERFPSLSGNTLLREALMLLGPRRGLRLGACEQMGLQRLYQRAVEPDPDQAIYTDLNALNT